jgi:hypothetical protein
MTTKRVQALVLATAAVAGYADPAALSVRSTRFSALRRTIWSMNCSSSCTGVAI